MSENNTVIVFDRIRENLLLSKKESFKEIINYSINQTLSRSLNTSITTLFVLISLFLFGDLSLRYFTIVLITGIVIGTFSSILIAPNLLLFFQKFPKTST